MRTPINLLLVLLFATFNMHAQTRIRAMNTYNPLDTVAGSYLDSTYYKFSAGRGGAPESVIYYDTSFRYVPYYPARVRQQIQQYDVKNNVVISINRLMQNDTFRGGDMSKRTYNAADLLLTDTVYVYNGTTAQWELSSISINTYGINNELLRYAKLNRNADQTGWDSVKRNSYYYTGNGNLAVVERYVGWPGIYPYLKDSVIYSYNSSNLCEVMLEKTYTALSWDTVMYTVYAYDANARITGEYENDYYDTTQAINTYYNTDGSVHSRIVSRHTFQIVDQDSTVYHYNADGHWATADKYLRQINMPWFDHPHSITKYYYETNFPSDVISVAAGNSRVSLCPVPATNILYLQVSEPNQQVYTVHVTDMQGRQVLHSSYLGNTRQGLDISALTAGTYTIQLMDTKGGVQHSKFTIQR